MARRRVVEDPPWERLERVGPGATEITPELLVEIRKNLSATGLNGLRQVLAWYTRHYSRSSPLRPRSNVEQRAADIKRWGRKLLRWVEDDPASEGRVALALMLGCWITDAAWSLGAPGLLARRGLKELRTAQGAGQKSGRERRAAARKEHARVLAAARALRRKHPHSRRFSTRRLAETIAHDLEKPLSTVRSILAQNRLR